MRWHDDGFPLIAVFQDPEQRQTGVVVKRPQHEVIKDDEVILLDVVDDLKKASVKFVERYTPDEPVHGEVSPLLYPINPDGTCQERFSASCRAVELVIRKEGVATGAAVIVSACLIDKAFGRAFVTWPGRAAFVQLGPCRTRGFQVSPFFLCLRKQTVSVRGYSESYRITTT